MVRPVLLLVLALTASRAVADDVEVFPAVTVHLEAARYAPSEPGLRWTTWIGAGATALRVGSWRFYGTADLETILGDELRTFDANQANYHLELGASAGLGRLTLTPFFHHVSRHLVDREKDQAADWNVLGLRLSGGSLLGSVPVRFRASLGRTTQASLPAYRWELIGAVEGDLIRWSAGAGYARGSFRHVTVDEDSEIPRGNFTDLTAEGGVRWTFGPRAVEVFAAFERRNDVFLDAPSVRDRALLGFRLLLAGSAP
jgi:hypothetical protein